MSAHGPAQHAVNLAEALRAAKGYMMNAAIDLETGTPKKTTLATLNGGIRMIDEALKKAGAA